MNCFICTYNRKCYLCKYKDIIREEDNIRNCAKRTYNIDFTGASNDYIPDPIKVVSPWKDWTEEDIQKTIENIRRDNEEFRKQDPLRLVVTTSICVFFITFLNIITLF